MTEVKTYKLKTIQDIFDKIPTDRVATCMAELTDMLVAASWQKEKHEDVAGLLGIEMEMNFPEFIEWVDDGLGELAIRINYKEVAEEENLKPESKDSTAKGLNWQSSQDHPVLDNWNAELERFESELVLVKYDSPSLPLKGYDVGFFIQYEGKDKNKGKVICICQEGFILSSYSAWACLNN